MFIAKLRHDLWTLIRWRIQHDAYHSNCNAEVLRGAGVLVAAGARTLGYKMSDPPQNHDAAFYKRWLTKATNDVLGALERLDILDGSMTAAQPTFQEAADKVAPCRAEAVAGEAEEPYFYPDENS